MIRPPTCPGNRNRYTSIGGVSTTSSNLGAAAGLSVTSESGAGAHLAIDWVNVEGGSPFGFAIGVHYMVGG